MAAFPKARPSVHPSGIAPKVFIRLPAEDAFDEMDVVAILGKLEQHAVIAFPPP